MLGEYVGTVLPLHQSHMQLRPSEDEDYELAQTSVLTLLFTDGLSICKRCNDPFSTKAKNAHTRVWHIRDVA